MYHYKHLEGCWALLSWLKAATHWISTRIWVLQLRVILDWWLMDPLPHPYQSRYTFKITNYWRKLRYCDARTHLKSNYIISNQEALIHKASLAKPDEVEIIFSQLKPWWMVTTIFIPTPGCHNPIVTLISYRMLQLLHPRLLMSWLKIFWGKYLICPSTAIQFVQITIAGIPGRWFQFTRLHHIESLLKLLKHLNWMC